MVLTVTSGRFAYSTMLLWYCRDQGLGGWEGNKKDARRLLAAAAIWIVGDFQLLCSKVASVCVCVVAGRVRSDASLS